MHADIIQENNLTHTLAPDQTIAQMWSNGAQGGTHRLNSGVCIYWCIILDIKHCST